MIADEILIRVGLNTKAVSDGINRMEKSFSHLKKIVAFAIGGKIAKDMAKFGKDMGVLADRTGTAVNRLSNLRSMFISAGSSANGFNNSVNKIVGGLSRLGLGDPAMASTFAAWGINPYKQNGDIRDLNEIYADIASAAERQLALGTSKNEVIQALMESFGVDAAMAEKLSNGRAAYLKDEKTLQEKIGVLSKGQIDNLTELSQKLSELGAAWDTNVSKVVADLSPMLGGIADLLTGVLKFAGENPKLSATVVAIAGITSSVGVLLPLLTKSVAGISSLSSAVGILVGKLGIYGLIGYLGGEAAAWVLNGTKEEDRKSLASKMMKDAAARGDYATANAIRDRFLSDEYLELPIETTNSTQSNRPKENVEIIPYDDAYENEAPYEKPVIPEFMSSENNYKIDIQQTFNGNVNGEEVKGAMKEVASSLKFNSANLIGG